MIEYGRTVVERCIARWSISKRLIVACSRVQRVTSFISKGLCRMARTSVVNCRHSTDDSRRGPVIFVFYFIILNIVFQQRPTWGFETETLGLRERELWPSRQIDYQDIYEYERALLTEVNFSLPHFLFLCVYSGKILNSESEFLSSVIIPFSILFSKTRRKLSM